MQRNKFVKMNSLTLTGSETVKTDTSKSVNISTKFNEFFLIK